MSVFGAALRLEGGTFGLALGPIVEGIAVRRVRGVELVSRPFRFDVEFASHVPLSILNQTLGTAATLTMEADGLAPRVVRGVVSSIRAVGLRPTDGALLATARVVPKLKLLARRRFSRIFQHRTVPDIVTRLFDEAEIAYDARLLASYVARDYCVQYQETDFDFVHRLLAEEGIFYWFEHPGFDEGATVQRVDPLDLRERVVLADAAVYAPTPGGETLVVRDQGPREGSDNGVHEFSSSRVVRSTRALVTSFDFMRPALELVDRATESSVSRVVEAIATSVTQSDPAPGAPPSRDEIYEHHDDHSATEMSPGRTARLLESERRRAVTATGRSRCRRLSAGHAMALHGHGVDELNGAWAITRVEHTGEIPEGTGTDVRSVYDNRFECVPATSAYRPRRPARKLQQVLETAIVVGPQNEEIYVDEHGRIRVQFHWDRDGRRDEHSSCWIRVAQTWAGTGWGSQFIPRIGMEVLVSFLGGDVDRPTVIGCVPNAHHPLPFPLPEMKTKSGIRTRSTPASEGFNELMFDDATGNELVQLRAERDLRERVGNDKDASVQRDQTHSVGRDRQVTIGGADTLDVARDRRESVSADRTVRVRGDARWEVGGAHHTRVEGVRGVHVSDDSDELFEGDARTVVVGDRATNVGGREQRVVNGDHHLHALGDVGAMVTARTGFSVTAGNGVTFTADEVIRFTCGESSIELTPGEVIVRGPRIVFEGADEVTARVGETWLQLEDRQTALVTNTIRLRADGCAAELSSGRLEVDADDSVRLYGPGGAVVLDSAAKLVGSSIQLRGSAGRKSLQSPEPDDLATETIDVVLEDHDGNPVPNLRWVVTTAAGRTYSGRLDDRGRARVRVDPGQCKVTFPELASAAWAQR